MEMKTYENIPKEKFQFVKKEDFSHDQKLETKPHGYMYDAFKRFCKNKGSVVAAVIIIILILFAIIAPFCTPYSISDADSNFAKVLPKCKLFANTNFWDGCSKTSVNETTFNEYYYAGLENGHPIIKNNEYTKENGLYTFRADSYYAKGNIYKNIPDEDYKKIQQYQNETGKQVLYPVVAVRDRPNYPQVQDKLGSYYYEVSKSGNEIKPKFTQDGKLKLLYKKHAVGSERPDEYDSIRIAGDGENGVEYEYALHSDSGWSVRINYYEYYIYLHTYDLKDGIKEPLFLFGATAIGEDILTHLATGARFSFLFAIAVVTVNLMAGAIYGAIAGYYGGKTDLIMERITDILSAIPSMIVITLLKLHMTASPQTLILFIAFFMTGWIGTAATTRMQFYRFKNQEYVFAARTLGARDRRLMWKHIFPNALGTLVTGSALAIPSMIYSEVNLSYLGIISLTSGNMTSVGTMLANGQAALQTFPHIIFFPSLFLALLMLSFNLFGNGLRDAFNPSLRGSEG